MYGLVKGEKVQEAFVKTNDPNIVDRYRVMKDEIYINKLQEQIDKIQVKIDRISEIVEYPTGASEKVIEIIDAHNLLLAQMDIGEMGAAKAVREKILSGALGAE